MKSDKKQGMYGTVLQSFYLLLCLNINLSKMLFKLQLHLHTYKLNQHALARTLKRYLKYLFIYKCARYK
jgi:hypothetical protein